MLPQTREEILIQHYVNSPQNLESAFIPENAEGIFSSDLDDVWEEENRYIDLFFERLGVENPEFGRRLPETYQDIATVYKNRKIYEPMSRIERRFTICDVTRGQINSTSEWAIDHYKWDPMLGEFANKGLEGLGLKFRWNTGHFEYPMQLLTMRAGLDMKILAYSNYSKLRYNKQGDDGVVVGIYPNVLWNKQAFNELKAREMGLEKHFVITLADSPRLEPFFPIYSGLAIWVTPEAHEVPVESHVNLYLPEATIQPKDLWTASNRAICQWHM